MNNIEHFNPTEPGIHLLTIAEWEEACDVGMFIDYDGFGYFCNPETKLELRGFDVIPSDYAEKREAYEQRKLEWTHVNWFNR